MLWAMGPGSSELSYFILRSQSLALYRRYLREIRLLPQPTKGRRVQNEVLPITGGMAFVSCSTLAANPWPYPAQASSTVKSDTILSSTNKFETSTLLSTIWATVERGWDSCRPCLLSQSERGGGWREAGESQAKYLFAAHTSQCSAWLRKGMRTRMYARTHTRAHAQTHTHTHMHTN